MSATTWVLIGLLSIFCEVLVPVGFAFFIFGLAAVLVGIATALGVLNGLEWQFITVAVTAAVVWLTSGRTLRSLFGQRGATEPAGGTTEGKRVRILEDIQPGEWGQGELWGSPWRVRNVGSSMLAKGAECAVVQTEGNGLLVRNEREG